MKVSKEFRFESAHRLSNYEGKCKRIHGHNYRGIVTAYSAELDDKGMVIDFGEIKDAVKKIIVEVFDHKLILQEGDELNQKIAEVLPAGDVVWVSYNPTAENMAYYFLESLRGAIPQIVQVEIYETDDSCAIASMT